MTKFSKGQLIDEAFDVFSKNPGVDAKDWGMIGKAVSDALNLTHPNRAEITSAELGTKLLTFNAVAEAHIMNVIGDPDLTTDVLEEIGNRWADFVLAPQ